MLTPPKLGLFWRHVPPAASATVLAICVVAAADVCMPAYIVLWHIHIVFACPTPFPYPPPTPFGFPSIDKMPRLHFRANCSLSWKYVAATCSVHAARLSWECMCMCVCVLSVCRVWLYVCPSACPVRLSVGAHMIYEWVTNLLPCSLSNQRRLCSPFFAFFIIVAMSVRLCVRVCVWVSAIVSVHTLAIATCTARWEPSRLDR